MQILRIAKMGVLAAGSGIQPETSASTWRFMNRQEASNVETSIADCKPPNGLHSDAWAFERG